ncbi:hypothetical protein EAI_03527, partial [Harpegnathos saltator]
YTMVEYADLHFVYGECQCNATQAAALYTERFPNRRHLYLLVFWRVHQRLRTEGQLIPRNNGGRSHVFNPGIKKMILENVRETPTTSVRRLERAIGITRAMVNRILRQ